MIEDARERVPSVWIHPVFRFTQGAKRVLEASAATPRREREAAVSPGLNKGLYGVRSFPGGVIKRISAARGFEYRMSAHVFIWWGLAFDAAAGGLPVLRALT